MLAMLAVLAVTGAAPAKSGLGQALLSESEKCALARLEIATTTTAFEIAIQDQRLPTENVGKELGRPGLVGAGRSLIRAIGNRVAGALHMRAGRLARPVGRFVLLEFGFQILSIQRASTTAPSTRSPHRPATPGLRLAADAISNPLGF